MTHVDASEVDALEGLELVGLNRAELADFGELMNLSKAELVEFSGLVDFRRVGPKPAAAVQLVMVHDVDVLEELAAFSREELAAFRREELTAFRREELAAFSREELAAFRREELAAFSREELAAFSKQDLVAFSRSELESFSSAELEDFSSPGRTNASCVPFLGWIRSISVSVTSLFIVRGVRWKNSDIQPKRVMLNASLPLPKLPQVKLPSLKLPQIGLPMVGLPLIVMTALVAPTIWLAKSPEGHTQSEPQVLPVETTVLEGESSYKVSRDYTGELVARRSSDLGFERMGTVIELLVEEGDTVAAGAPLARLDTRDLSAQRLQLEAQKRQLQAQLKELEVGPRQEDIRSAEAAVSDLRNQLELAQLQADRRAVLYEKGAISREELDERQFGANAIADRLQQAKSQLEELLNGTRQEQLAAQVAQIDQIDARIEALDISLDKSVLYAPFSGTVAERTIDEGSVTSNGQSVLRLVESGRLEVRIGVPEGLSQRLSVGSQQPVTVGKRTYSARVTARLPEVDEASQTVTMVLEIDDPYVANEQSIGATARLQVNERQVEPGYWLPSTALVASDRGLWSVYVLSEPQENAGAFEVARRDVEVLYSEGDRAFVRGLVQPGDIAITNGTHRIVPGQLVKPDQRPAQGRNAE